MKNINKLKNIILAIGVLASVAFYVKEYGIGKGNEIVSFDNESTAAGEADTDPEMTDDTYLRTEKETGAADAAGEGDIDSKITVRLSEEDRAFIEEIVRAAVSEEIYKISSEAGYLEAALEKAQALAVQQAAENVGKVNINTAGVEELTTLDGIGEKRAEDIISYREQAGGFKSIDELMNIKGIKQAAFDKIKDKIYVANVVY